MNFLKDRLTLQDINPHHNGLWAKTVVMRSTHDVEADPITGISHFVRKVPVGVSKLGETLFKKEVVEPDWTTSNMVPIGGCQFAMESIFSTKGDQIDIPTLYKQANIGAPDSLPPSEEIENFLTPNGNRVIVHRPGNFVQLFGIGVTGTAENDITVHPVNYRENSIDINRVTTDGLTLTGTMLPFRFTDIALSENERLQYFGKKIDGQYTAYYLKRFENEPVIKHIWKTGEDVDNETLVSSSDVWNNNVGVNAIESFTECVIKISKKDVKEWFIHQGHEDNTRFNTIALFSGEFYKKDPNLGSDTGDYRDVKLFSKLNIRPEYLTTTKDVNYIYRVYTS